MRIRRAVIIARKWVLLGGKAVCLYRTVVASAETGDSWTVWRRYSQFRALRDNLMALMGKSRTALPMPSRRPWALSAKDENMRQLGLNSMLKMLMSSATLRESPMVRNFFSSDAELGMNWQELVQELENINEPTSSY
jgi:hypothetical protein